MVAARIWLRGGSRLETIPGQSLVTGRLLAEGSRQRSWDRIARDAEDRGMMLSSGGTGETLVVAIDALADDWEDALAWLAELVFEPTFPTDRFDWIRRQAAGELESLMDQPEVRTARSFQEQLYGSHPYSRPLQGDAGSLARLTVEDCRAFHRQALGWGGVVIVTGAIDEEAVMARATSLFADLDRPAVPLPPVAVPVVLPPARNTVRAGQADQAHLFAGHLSVPRVHPDRVALDLLAVVLGAGAGLSGRLPDRIREKEGLAYSTDIATMAGAGLDAGRFAAYVGTAPRTVEQAERALREELARLLDAGLEDEEVEEARAYLVGRDPFRRESARQWVSLLAEAEIYGLPVEDPAQVKAELEALHRADVEAAARRHLDLQALQVTVGLP